MRNIKCTEKNVGNYSLENFEFIEEKKWRETNNYVNFKIFKIYSD